MKEHLSKSSLRIIPGKYDSREDYLLYLRHLFAYAFAKDTISGNSLVLEVGCGEGYGTSLLSEHVANIVGLDVDKTAVAHARRKYGSEKCVFTLYDGLKIPYENNMFDAVVSFQVIEHVQDDANFISEIHRVLKSNGIFMVTTPNRTLRMKPGQKPWNRFHIREYYPDELTQILKRSFSDVRMLGISGNTEVQRIELERVKQILKLISLDPLNLRKLIPDAIKQQFTKILNSMMRDKQGAEDNEDFVSKFSITDYHVVETNVSESLDLLGILKKSS